MTPKKRKMEKKEEEKEPNFELDFLTHYLKSNLESLDAMFVSLDTNRMAIVRFYVARFKKQLFIKSKT